MIQRLCAATLAIASLTLLATSSADAAVSYVEGRQARSNGNVLSLSILSNYNSGTLNQWLNGDVVVAHIYIGSTKAETMTPPAGWTLLRADSGSNSQYWIFYRVINNTFHASGSLMTFTWTTAWNALMAIQVVRGANTANPIDDVGMHLFQKPNPTNLKNCSTKYAQGGGMHLMWLYHADNSTTSPVGDAIRTSDGTLYPGVRSWGQCTTATWATCGAFYYYAIPAGGAGVIPQYQNSPLSIGTESYGSALTIRNAGAAGSTTTTVCSGASATDLSVTMTDGSTTYRAGQSVTYNVDITSGGANVTGITPTITLDAKLSGITWTCATQSGAGAGTCSSASGSGTTWPSVNVNNGGTMRIAVTGTVSASPSGSLVSSASVPTSGAGWTDSSTGNNSASDTDTITTDPSVVVTAPATPSYVQGQTATWRATITNSGVTTSNLNVTLTLPAGVSSLSWTCSASGGNACGAASGTTATPVVTTLTSGGTVTYDFSGTVAATTFGTITASATISGGSIADWDNTDNTSSIGTPMRLANFLVTASPTSVNLCPSNTGYTDYAITPRDSGNATIANFRGQVTLSMGAYAKGDYSLVTGTGSLANGTANDGAGTYTFNADGTATLRLTTTTAGSGTLTASAGTASGSAASVTFAATPNAFTISTPNEPLLGTTLVAGRDHQVRIAASCGGTSYTGAKNIKFWMIKDPSHPEQNYSGTGTGFDDFEANRPGIKLTAGGALQTVTVANSEPRLGGGFIPTGGLSTAEARAVNVSVTFNASGQADIYLSAGDVGKYTLVAKDTVASITSNGAPIFTARPFGLRFQQNDSSLASGAIRRSAGTTFTDRVQAVRWESADDANNDGVPDAGADLSNNATISAFFWPTTISVGSYEPSTGVPGSLGGSPNMVGTSAPVGPWWGGGATFSISYSEVGAFKPRATAANYLNTAGLTVQDNQTYWFGRFTPAQFAISSTAGVFNPGCGATYTYLGQPFTLSSTTPRITVTAQNAAGTTTQNYTKAGGWFKIGGANISGYTYDIAGGYTMNNGTLPTPSVTNNDAGTPGTALIDFALGGSGISVTRPGSPVNPFNAAITLRASVTDSDGILPVAANPQSVSMSFAGAAAAMRWGWVEIVSSPPLAQPSVTTNLSIPLQAKYRDASGLTQDATNGCAITFNKSALGIGFPGGTGNNLATCETAMSSASVTLAAATGTGTLQLLAPGVGDDGSGTVALNVFGAAGNYCIAQNGGGGANYPVVVSAGFDYLVPSGGNPTATFSFGGLVSAARARVLYRSEGY